MKSWLKIVGFEIKIQAKSKFFWLLTCMLLVVSISASIKYFNHYQLKTPADLTSILSSSTADNASIPVAGKDRNTYFIKGISNRFIENNKQDSDKIIKWLSSTIYSRETWTKDTLRDVENQMYTKFPSVKKIGYGQDMLYNEYTMSGDKMDATYSEFMSYLHETNQTFSTSFARQYAQDTAMYVSIIFILFFAFLFQKELQPSLHELLLSKPISKITYITARFTGAFSMCLFAIAFNTMIFSIWETIFCSKLGMPLYLGALWTNILFYTVPTILFYASLMVLVSLLFRNGFAAIPLFFITLLSSSITITLPDGTSVQWMWLATVMSYDKFYQLVPPQQMQAYIINRIGLCILGVIFLLASCRIWDRTSESRKRSRKFKFSHVSSIKHLNPPKNSGAFAFVKYNAKIAASPIQLSIAFILLLSTITTMLTVNTGVTEIGTSILGTIAWASVIIFANIYSVEYSHKTMDNFYLTNRNKLGIMARRIFINLCFIFVMVSIVFFIDLFLTDKSHGNVIGTIILMSYFKTIITCMSCSIFFGVCSMTISNFLCTGIGGIVGGFLINAIFLSTAVVNRYSIFNIYISNLSYTNINQDRALWWKSAIIFIGISLMIFMLNKWTIYRSNKVELRVKHSTIKPK
ncbi:ABC transporter permease subunit [Clostridium estertheticum]|uniref:ABC transporter permease subunit n=1 Tax=Clostridium estertheticum TaxID=238834 RepID=UPI001C0D0BBB|nr:ABC transporter permease subunit [Clostridium estertheticum]MBU3215213.1 ABC transporter permease subunit [Clostridium estertheticum]WAG56849.1 ABC transporter permease subunit [Clostridium estertheticum]